MCAHAQTVSRATIRLISQLKSQLNETPSLARVSALSATPAICCGCARCAVESAVGLAHFTDSKESIMTDVKTHTHMACEEHHLAAARHVSAAYHHFQAVAELNKGNQQEAKVHIDAATNEGGAAIKHAATAVKHSHK
jgi:coenzyme F420-reducing hydrogenase beta subunit